MDPIEITNIETFVKYLQFRRFDKDHVVLYRGQSKDYSLLPAIARKDPAVDTAELEKEMLAELKRRSQSLDLRLLKNDWDWLVYAQHYGMKTRLLDWTTNPLAALWFACKDERHSEENSYVYIFHAKKTALLNKEKSTNPFNPGGTKILQPPQNNNRIIAQSGWFTAHNYSKKTSKFVGLEKNVKYKEHIVKLYVNPSVKAKLLIDLNMLGVNHQSMFPDFEGMCKQINWEKINNN